MNFQNKNIRGVTNMGYARATLRGLTKDELIDMIYEKNDIIAINEKKLNNHYKVLIDIMTNSEETKARVRQLVVELESDGEKLVI